MSNKRTLVEEPHLVGVHERSDTLVLDDGVDLVDGLVGVEVHRQAGLAGRREVLPVERLVDCRQTVGCEHRPNPAVGAAIVLAGERESLLELLVGCRLRLADRDTAVPESGTQPRFDDDIGNLGHEKVHIAERGGAGADHLGDTEGSPGADIAGLEFGLDRPDILAEPGLKRLVVGRAAEQRHRDVCVCVDQPRDNESTRRVETVVGLAGEITVLGVRDRRDCAAVGVDQHVRALDTQVRPEQSPADDCEFSHASMQARPG